MREIKTQTQGYKIIIDDADFELVSKYKWYPSVRKNGVVYAVTNVYLGKGKQKTTYIHRIIMQPPSDMVVDHINGNPLDNRRSNLRVVTEAENLAGYRTKHNPENSFDFSKL